jgi:putative transposase
VAWRESTTVDERLQFVTEYRDGLETMTALCAYYGISRETGYKWVARFAAEGGAGLADRSRRPHTSPRTTSAAVVAALIAARQRRPHWGPKKLLAAQWPMSTRPAVSTASAILKRAGLIAPRGRRRRVAPAGRPLTPMTTPNAVWTIDFKGQFRTGDGAWCYPLTVVDGCSRYLLGCHALPSVATPATQAALIRLFREFGLPSRIRSDNGAPFASAQALGGLSTLAVWWIRLGIVPERIAPGRPAQNGRHERLHRTLKAETARPPAASRRAQQRRFRAFRREYNELRPHEALQQQPPAQHYTASPRRYPATLPPLTYPHAELIRRVGPSGSINWRGRRLCVSHALSGLDIGLTAVADGRWAVYCGPVLLAHFDERDWCLYPLRRPHPAGGQAD